MAVLQVAVAGIEGFHRKQQLIIGRILVWNIRAAASAWDVITLGDTPASFRVILPRTDVKTAQEHAVRVQAEFQAAMARLGILDLISLNASAAAEATSKVDGAKLAG